MIRIARAALVTLFVTVSFAGPAMADEAPDPQPEKKGCSGGLAELGLGSAAALLVVARRARRP